MLRPGIVIISYLQGTKKWTELPKSACPAAGDPTPPATCPDTELRLEAAVQAGVSPEGEEGKKIAALHRRWLTFTGNRYDPAKHRGIAELYVIDERFTTYYDKQVPGCARFLRDAVALWAK